MADRTFASMEAFGGFLLEQAAGEEVVMAEMAEAAATILAHNALLVFGDNAKLAPLAASTQEERERLGFTPDEPLFRDGSLLYDKVEQYSSPVEASIGSPEIVQLYHELGYESPRSGPVPARPVFKTALDESEEEVLALMEGAAGALLGVSSVPGKIERIEGYGKL